MTAPLALDWLEDDGLSRPYVDGAEERLLDLFDSDDAAVVAARVEDVLGGEPTWAERIHLSPRRHHLLDWYPFAPSARLLEVGAGCGALTGLLATRVAHVDALEPMPARARVVASRLRSAPNVSVLVGALKARRLDQREYDTVTLVGVLEYAGMYSEPGIGDLVTPYLALLRRVHQLLVPGGTLVLAIENQLGLKYLAGAPEDHYGTPLVGIEDYLHGHPRTFARRELMDLVAKAGFEIDSVHYPFPDYKFPTSIYSDEFPPGSLDPPGAIYPGSDPDDGVRFFAEARVARVLSRNGLATEFANSFLVTGTRR